MQLLHGYNHDVCGTLNVLNKIIELSYDLNVYFWLGPQFFCAGPLDFEVWGLLATTNLRLNTNPGLHAIL